MDGPGEESADGLNITNNDEEGEGMMRQDPITNDSFDSSSDNSSGSDEESDSNEELMQVCTVIAPPPDTASPQELHEALGIAQKLLLNMRGWCRELLKKNVLLETSASQG
ncbi:hypothetical protein BDR03DRAFT_1013549 [Suillus americanus]|nr:hypothetical protein BDR03DRAFT_1013549 [Suillus americanus]